MSSGAVRPRLIFAPYWVDSHPDHVAATDLIEACELLVEAHQERTRGRALFPSRILYYFCADLRIVTPPAFVIDISATAARKRASIECYHSQFIAGREAQVPSFIDRSRDHAAFWAGRSASTTANPSPAAKRWDSPAWRPLERDGAMPAVLLPASRACRSHMPRLPRLLCGPPSPATAPLSAAPEFHLKLEKGCRFCDIVSRATQKCHAHCAS